MLRSLICILCLSHQLSALSHEFYIGGHHNYTNVHSNNAFDVEGYQTGVAAGYEIECNCYFAEAAYEGYWTIVNAVGSPCDTSALTEHLMWLRLGYSFDLSCVYRFKPYVGVGYNYYENSQDPDSLPLDWRYKKIFIPVGFLVEGPLCRDLYFGLRGEWRPDVYSTLKVGTTETIETDLKLAHGFRIETPLTYFFDWSHCYHIQFVPFYDWNRFGESEEENSNGIVLPIDSETRWNIGFRVLLGVRF
ncbi:MAG: autotransporter outer membrane beta-barrel domain-containing protein [Waddliaceae bacterium]